MSVLCEHIRRIYADFPLICYNAMMKLLLLIYSVDINRVFIIDFLHFINNIAFVKIEQETKLILFEISIWFQTR